MHMMHTKIKYMSKGASCTLVLGEFSFKKRDTPPMVPPVPVAAQKASILPLVWYRISGPAAHQR
jgi:hypothetical protein